MYINMQNDLWEYNRQTIPYVEIIHTNVSSDGTFSSLNDLFDKLSIKIKGQTDKEKIFDIYKNCIYFGVDESNKLSKYIKTLSVEEKDNIFDYYD